MLRREANKNKRIKVVVAGIPVACTGILASHLIETTMESCRRNEQKKKNDDEKKTAGKCRSWSAVISELGNIIWLQLKLYARANVFAHRFQQAGNVSAIVPPPLLRSTNCRTKMHSLPTGMAYVWIHQLDVLHITMLGAFPKVSGPENSNFLISLTSDTQWILLTHTLIAQLKPLMLVIQAGGHLPEWRNVQTPTGMYARIRYVDSACSDTDPTRRIVWPEPLNGRAEQMADEKRLSTVQQ